MRLFIKLSLAALAIGTTFSLAPVPVSFVTPTSAQYRHDPHGGVTPCGRDDYRFVQNRGWVSNCRRGHVGPTPRHHGHRSHGYTTRTYTIQGPPVAVYRGTVAVPVATCAVNRTTGETVCFPY